MKTPRLRLIIFPLLLISGLGGASASAQDPPAPEAYRRHALTNQGDSGRGAKLFHDPRLICANCHSVDGSASKAGPDLSAAGDAFGRADLIDAVLRPSATIAPGYGAVIVETKSGEVFQGTLKEKSDAGVRLTGADGKPVFIAAAELKTQTGSPVSLMPEGLQANVSPREFTDLIEYLTTLKQPESALTGARGMPPEIPRLAKPVTLRPFFTHEFKLPREGAETGLSSFRQIPAPAGGFLVLHQKGVIWRAEKTETGEEHGVFLDLTGEVFCERGPNGLLDAAFHPGFLTNRKYYLFYQIFEKDKVVSQIVERKFTADFKADDPAASPRVLLKIESVAEDHSGGCLMFGPDGFLYIVMGDTGPHNDPNGHAQNLTLLLGKLLRVDVDREDPGLPYAIPPDNPFRDRPDARPEIWAYGLRNPWRFSFDRVTGDLWLADVGQDRVEEVAIVRRGENHGWNVYEGFEPFSNRYRQEGEIYTQPVFAYRRKYGNSITGGHVYRGAENPSFQGVYVCGDYNSKHLFGITVENDVLKTARVLGDAPQRIVSFAEDREGNLHAVGYEGAIHRIDLTGARFE